MIRICSKYLQQKLLFQFFMVYCVFLSIIWLTQSLRFVELITLSGVNPTTFLKVTGFLILPMSHVCIPLALLFACVISFSQLDTSNELVVLKGCGLSSWQIYKSLLGVITIIFLLHLSISLYMMPKSYQFFKSMRHTLQNALVNSSFEEGVFNTRNNLLTIYIDEKVGDFSYRNIFIYDLRNKDKPLTITARHGEFVDTQEGPGFILYDGTHQLEDKAQNKVMLGVFQQYNFVLKMPEGESATRVIDVNELFLSQLLDEEGKSVMLGNQHKVYALQRLAWPFFNFILTLIVVVSMCTHTLGRGRNVIKPIKAALLGTVAIAALLLLNNLSLKTFEYVYVTLVGLVVLVLVLVYKASRR